MNLKRMMSVLCVACFLMTGCTTDDGLTASGSEEWSRGVIIGTSRENPVAVATWERTTFVTWIAENGHVQLAQLDTALNLESVTDLTLTAAYPYNLMLLEAESSDRLHVAWLDSIEGQRTIIHAQLAIGEPEPLLRQEIPLPGKAKYVQFVMHPEAERLEIFWSADESDNSGIYHQAASLTGGQSTPPVRLTEIGWQPVAGWGRARAMQVTWSGAGETGYYVIWRADFDPEEQALDNSVPVTQVRIKRWRRFLGPAVGNAGTRNVVAWAIGWRSSAGLGRQYDAPNSAPLDFQMGVGLSKSHGAGGSVTSDKGQYAIAPTTLSEEDAPIYPLTTGRVVEIWEAPRIRTVGDRTWVFFSAWVARRSEVRMQFVVVPFDESGLGEPVAVSKTRPSSIWPDLAVSADSTLKAAWVEPLGNDVFQVVVASTAPEAREALGGFRLAEWGNDVATFVFENVSLLGYTPYVIGWAVLPLGLLLVVTFLSSGGVRGWKAMAWLGVAIILQLACKRFFASPLLPFELGLEGFVLSVTPVALGIALVWSYWRRAKEPLLLAAYGLFIGTDAAFSIFVVLPRLLWSV
jgi:hypothetical protein